MRSLRNSLQLRFVTGISGMPAPLPGKIFFRQECGAKTQIRTRIPGPARTPARRIVRVHGGGIREENPESGSVSAVTPPRADDGPIQGRQGGQP